jgi:hypothetical protein
MEFVITRSIFGPSQERRFQEMTFWPWPTGSKHSSGCSITGSGLPERTIRCLIEPSMNPCSMGRGKVGVSAKRTSITGSKNTTNCGDGIPRDFRKKRPSRDIGSKGVQADEDYDQAIMTQIFALEEAKKVHQLVMENKITGRAALVI